MKLTTTVDRRILKMSPIILNTFPITMKVTSSIMMSTFPNTMMKATAIPITIFPIIMEATVIVPIPMMAIILPITTQSMIFCDDNNGWYVTGCLIKVYG